MLSWCHFSELKTLYSNSDEISELIESVCGLKVTPLECLDEGPGELLLFDFLCYPEFTIWTVEELLALRPEWEQQVLPLLKARGYAFLFGIEWCKMNYLPKYELIRFEPLDDIPKSLKDKQCLLSTSGLTFPMKRTLTDLVAPATYAVQLSERLSDRLEMEVDFDHPFDFKEICQRMEEVVMSLNQEVEAWKDRFFFDAMEADEDHVLCSECKEDMRKAFYESQDRRKALAWRPDRNKFCRYFKIDVLED